MPKLGLSALLCPMDTVRTAPDQVPCWLLGEPQGRKDVKADSNSPCKSCQYLAPATCKALWGMHLWALPWTAPLCWAMSACGLPSMSPVSSHVAVWPPLLPRPPCIPKLTVLSTQATERPAKRLATPRATLTSSLRMSSQRLLRNLNNLSVYVATPGEKRKGGWWMVAQCAGRFRDTCHRWLGPQVDR